MKFEINKNEKYNSFEIVFDGKPAAAVRDVLKARRFRWNNARGLWYGYAEDAGELAAALNSAADGNSEQQNSEAPEKQNSGRKNKRAALLPLWDRCRVSDLPGYGTENELNSAARKAAHENSSSYDKEAAKIIRADLKKRFPEMKISVTSGGAGYLNCVDIRILSGPYGKVEKTVYVYGDPETRTVPGDELQAVLDYCEKLHDAFDADDGDIYADYGAHHDLYGSACVAYDYKQTEQTPEQLADIEAFRKAKAEHEAAEEARQRAEFEREQAKREAEAAAWKIRDEQNKQKVSEIEAAAIVEEIPEEKQRIFSGLQGGAGKEANISEVLETISEREEIRTEKARVSRTVRFPSEQLYNDFCGLFMYDFSFLSGKGGTDTEDPRVTGENFQKLNREQRESVEFIMVDCVAVYVGDDLKLIIDPEGYNYARYVYLVPEDAEKEAEQSAEYKQRIEAEAGEAFYFPAPMAEQIKNLTPGENVTILSVCPWTMTASVERGGLVEAMPEQYAQHKDAAKLSYKIGRKMQEKHVYNGDTAETVIYSGLLPDLPREMLYTTERVGAGAVMERVNFSGAGVRDFIKAAIRYYAGLGYVPAVDTVQR